jgi:hypothetical protein
MLRSFSREIHHYSSNVPKENEIVEWLALMQHHGAPTRLLDCSRSFYVAAFFALENAAQDAAIWAFNASSMQIAFSDMLQTQEKLNADQAKTLKKMLPQYYNDELLKLKRKLLDIAKPTPAAVLIEPFIKNECLRTQQGLFLCPLDLTFTVDQNLRGLWRLEEDVDMKEIGISDRISAADLSTLLILGKVIKIVLPEHIRSGAIEDLAAMNVTSTTLFPGLDGFARSLVHCFNPWSNKDFGLPRLAHIGAVDEKEIGSRLESDEGDLERRE